MFTIGCDPEFFVKENGKPVAAYGLIPGSKEAPHPVPGGAIQVDGTAVEFNTDPVSLSNFEEFNRKIVTVIGGLKQEIAKTGNYSLAVIPVQDYDPDYLASLPKKATELGCDPDYNAYTMEVNPMPDGERPFRTGAGHIHVGWGSDIPVDNPEHHEICAGFIKALDATVGLFMTVIDREPRRRELYGKAGAYRAKPYGVEYRVPSNAWLTTKQRRAIVHGLVNRAVSWMQTGTSILKITGCTEQQIRDIIDSGNWASAKNILMMGGSDLKYRMHNYFVSPTFMKEFPNG